jgi:hypothetical protein
MGMKELNIGGIFLAPMVGYLVIAYALYWFVERRFLTDIERRVWHPPLFRLCVFVILLAVVALFF